MLYYTLKYQFMAWSKSKRSMIRWKKFIERNTQKNRDGIGLLALYCGFYWRLLLCQLPIAEWDVFVCRTFFVRSISDFYDFIAIAKIIRTTTDDVTTRHDNRYADLWRMVNSCILSLAFGVTLSPVNNAQLSYTITRQKENKIVKKLSFRVCRRDT